MSDTKREPIFWFEKTFQMAGINMSGYDKTKLREGQVVKLEREPNNPHDKNAIKILDGADERIAYVPRQVAEVLAPRMDLKKYPFKAYAAVVDKEPGSDIGRWGVKLEFYRFPEDIPHDITSALADPGRAPTGLNPNG